MALHYIVREHEYLIEADTSEDADRLLVAREGELVNNACGTRRTVQVRTITNTASVDDELLDQEPVNAADGKTARQVLES